MKLITTKALAPVIVGGAICLGGVWAAEAQNTPPAQTPNQTQGSSMMQGPGGMMGGGDMPGPRRMGRHGMGMFGWDHGRMGRGDMDRRDMGRPGFDRRGMGGMGAWGIGPRGRLMGLVCSNRGAEALDIALVRLSYRLNLTAEQRTLFDDLRNTALDEQKKFAETCQTKLPRRAGGSAPDPVQIFRDHIEVETAKLAAMNAVLPKFEALYQSLDDNQKQMLLPRGMRGPAARPAPEGQPGAGGGQRNAPGGNMGQGGNMAPGGGNGMAPGGQGSEGGNNSPSSNPNTI